MDRLALRTIFLLHVLPVLASHAYLLVIFTKNLTISSQQGESLSVGPHVEELVHKVPIFEY